MYRRCRTYFDYSTFTESNFFVLIHAKKLIAVPCQATDSIRQVVRNSPMREEGQVQERRDSHKMT